MISSVFQDRTPSYDHNNIDISNYAQTVLNTNNKIMLSTQSKLKTPKNTNLKPKSTLT